MYLFDINWTRVANDLCLVQSVANGGYPNVYGAKIKIHICWDIDWLDDQLQDYWDREVIQFLQYRWPANHMPGAPDPVHNHINHASANKHPLAITNYIRKEIQLGAVMGHFIDILFSSRVGISPLSTRPKRLSDDRRVILDLSFPEGGSVNDYTPKESYLGMAINLVYPSSR